MNTIMKHLQSHKGVCDWKINITRRESYELFFVKGSLETVRNTDNTDKEVTVPSPTPSRSPSRNLPAASWHS